MKTILAVLALVVGLSFSAVPFAEAQQPTAPGGSTATMEPTEKKEMTDKKEMKAGKKESKKRKKKEKKGKE